MKKFNAIGLGLAVFFVSLAPIAQAAEFIAPKEADNGTLVLSSKDLHRNLYVVGSTVFVNSTTEGDLYAGAGTLVVDGSVEQDANVAAGTLTLNGPVGGDARVAGGTLTINSRISGDLLIGGGEIHISEKAMVGGDLVVGAGDVVIDAPVTGSLRIGGGKVVINAPIGGGVTIHSSDSVTFGSKARVNGSVRVSAPAEPAIEEGASVSKPEFTKTERQEPKKGLAAVLTLWFLIKFIAYSIAGFVLIYLLPKRGAKIVQTMRDSFGPSLGIGLVTAIVVPILAIIILITVIGFYVALIAFVLYALLLLLGCLFAALFAGSFIMKYATKSAEMVLDWKAVLVGTLVYVIIGTIPGIGWIVQMVLSLVAIGSLIKFVRAQLAQDEV